MSSRIKKLKKQSTKFWTFNLSICFAITWAIVKEIYKPNDTVSVIISIILALLAIVIFQIVVCLSLSFYERLKVWIKDSYWGECMILIEQAQNILLYRKSDDNRFRKKTISESINLLQQTMKIITGMECGISIKVPDNPSDDPLSWTMITLMRDPQHFERDNRVYQQKKHNVSANTAYLTTVNKLYEGEVEFKYILNNRLEHPDYKCTSDDCYPSLPQFRSEIVCPIINPEASKDSYYELRGFLCVDCSREYPFKNTTYSATIVSIYAKRLHPILSKENKQNEGFTRS